MNTRSMLGVVCLGIALGSRAQPVLQVQQTSSPPSDTSYSAVSRNAHSTVWQRTTYELIPSGEWFPHVHRFVETATGLNFFDSATGTWQPSVEDIEPISGGAAATTGQHKVSFAADLATIGAISLQMPDGHQLQTELMGLCYSDQASGKTVFIAVVTNCIGEIVGSNQVWYENAFAGLKASAHYSYTKAGFEQDIIVEECPPPPESYGLNSATTVLQAVTGIESAPAAAVSATKVSSDVGSQESDETIQFPDMRIGRGRAFLIGNSDSAGVAVAKHWTLWSGQRVLVEQIPMLQIASQLQTLPYAKSSAAVFSNSVVNVVSAKRLRSNTPVARRNTQPLKFASARPKKGGFVLDYISLNTSQTNFVFQGDTTYYLSGNVNLFGSNTVFEGGSVLKFATNVTLTVDSPVAWHAKPYLPVNMLSKDDNATGETVSGSTGAPGSNYYANVALNFDGTSALTNLTVDNLRILNAAVGIALNGQSGHLLSDVQLVNCGRGIAATNTDFSLHNALFYTVQTNFAGNTATGIVEQLTSDTAAWLNQNIGANLFLTNCLLAAVTNLGSCTTQSVAIANSNNGVFQTALPGGLHYLLTNSPYLTLGTTNISSATLALLHRKTTFAPIVYTNITIPTNVTFNPQALRDTNVPILGYHYDPLDFVFGGVISNANLTFAAGTAVGWYRTTSGYRATHTSALIGFGINMSNTAVADFQGTAAAPDYWVRCNTVQEQDTSGGQGPGGITGSDDQSNSNIALSAEVHLNFTECTAMAGDQGNFFRDDFGYLIVRARNSEFDSGNVGGYVLSGYFTNCLWDRGQGAQVEGHPGNQWIMRNCTFHGGQLTMGRVTTFASIPVSVRDCSFDGSTFNLNDSLSGNPLYTDYDYNAYTNATDPFPIGGTHDRAATVFGWRTNWLGNYYLPPTSLLIDAGDVTADTVGLFEFTSQTNQLKETNSIVDIGYHYVATDSNGNPLSTYVSGTPDYLVDVGGNGFDSNGLPYWWEGQYFGRIGLNPNTIAADGLTYLQDSQLGLSPLVDESAQTSTRANYTYDPDGWLQQVTGARSGSITSDNQGNIQQSSQ